MASLREGKIIPRYFRMMVIVLLVGLLLSLAKSHLYALQTIAREDSEISRVIYLVNSYLGNKIITHVDTKGEKLVALTFDDGPDPLYSNDVLEILARHNIKATFFVVGENVQAHPQIVKREIGAGHEIENHTYTHADLSLANAAGTEEEIQKTDDLLNKLFNLDMKYFRPPKKLFRPETLDIAKHKGYQTVLWSICVENSQASTPQAMAKRVIDAARPGMIILAHDGRADRSKTLLALPIIIEALQQQGYQFVTLEGLLKTADA